MVGRSYGGAERSARWPPSCKTGRVHATNGPASDVPPRTVRTAVARVVSDALQPPVTVGGMLLLSPAASPGWPGTWWYGALAVLFVCVLPFGILLALVRAGRVVDHDVSERSQRAPVLVMSLACIAAGLGVLALLGAPASVLAMVVALLGPTWWWALALVPLVGWARVTLGAHTLGQVLAGMTVGPLVIVGLWQALLGAA